MKFNTYIDNIIGTPPNTMVGNIKNTIVSIYPVSSINYKTITVYIIKSDEVKNLDKFILKELKY